MQSFYKNVGLKDIPWNFVIGEDGYVYEARGFHYVGENPAQDDNVTDSFRVHIAYMVTIDQEPTPSQRMLFKAFLEKSVRRDMLRSDFSVLRPLSYKSVMTFSEKLFENCIDPEISNITTQYTQLQQTELDQI